MRKIVILRGPQGSGKSSLIAAAGLAGHHLSFDKAREFISGDTLNHLGGFTVPQQHNALAWLLTMESLERRMQAGETIAFEGTLPKSSDLKKLIARAKDARYETLVVDLYGLPKDTVRARNAARPERTRVPDRDIDRVLRENDNSPALDDACGAEILRVTDFAGLDAAQDAIRSFLDRGLETRDLSAYARIVHVGDIQGSLSPLLDPLSPLAAARETGLDPETFYIFLGDLFDRGVENGKVARWWLDVAQDAPNVVLIAGNHEDHVEREAMGKAPVSDEWAQKTMPDLVAHGITRDDLARIADRTLPLFAYRWRGVDVLCTHGGLGRWVENLALVPVSILRAGSGHFDQSVDTLWAEHEAGTGRVQVHGHRNPRLAPADAAPGSFNLEAGVEFGGHLRFLTLDEGGFTPLDIRSTEFRSMQDDFRFRDSLGKQRFGVTAPIMPWILRGEEALEPLTAATLQGLEDHAMVSIRPQASMPHVASVNFTKDAFFSAAWDHYTTMARGLFIDRLDQTVVARSYPKFWNHGERPETSDDALEAGLSFPVIGYAKENGFLCITGYSERTGELVIASKSMVDGSFAEMAQEVVRDKLGAAGLEKLLRFNRDQKASLVFELIDPVRDPHIIAEAEPRLVLLAAIRRHERFEQCAYADLEKIGKWLGCEVKAQVCRITSWPALQALMARVETDPKWQRGAPLEGLVLQDAAGAQLKVKSWYYASWKRMRGAVDRIALIRRKGTGSFRADRYAEMIGYAEIFGPFLAWAETLPSSALELGIVELRRLWTTDPKAAETMAPLATDARPAPRDFRAILKGAEALAGQVAAGRAKPDSVRRFVEKTADDPEMRAAFEAHPSAAVLTGFLAS